MPELEPAPDPVAARRLRRIRIVIAVFVVLVAAFWIFAFSPLARDLFTAVDQLDDEALAAELEARCAAALVELDALPPAREARSPAERAETVIVANGILEMLVAELAATPGGTEDDRRLVDLWLQDWEIYLDDRSRHVDRLLTEGDVRFLVTEDGGVFVAERMDGFARVNAMDSCETPGDL